MCWRFFLLACLSTCAVANAEIPEGSLPLWPEGAPYQSADDEFQPYLEKHLLEVKGARGAVIVLPGGGYAGRAPHEGAPIAEALNAAGLHAVVCQYRVTPHHHPAPWLDATRAVKMVRAHAKEWNILPEHVAILGFSAGGHLAASTGVLDVEVAGLPDDETEKEKGRPDAMVLCYPVLSSGEYGHRGSFKNLLGDAPTQEQLNLVSLEKQVNDKTPPAFLWSTADDQAVPVENSLLFSLALRKNKIPFEMHIYPSGPHGLGLAKDDAHIATWMPLCAEWLKAQGW